MSDLVDVTKLWLKSRLFINRALDPRRDFDEQAFWACNALELLGKTALAEISPLLIVNPTDDGKSLLAAVNIGDDDCTTVQAKTVWSRCARAFKPFESSAAATLSKSRNEYIHSAGLGFHHMPESAWWQNFWPLVATLLHHAKRELEDYVDPRYIPEIQAHLNARKDATRRNYEARVQRSQNFISQRSANTLSARQIESLQPIQNHYFTYGATTACPACHAPGKINGDHIEDVQLDYVTDEWGDVETFATGQVDPILFECTNCRLSLDSFELLAEANLDMPFEAEVEVDAYAYAYEPEYNNE